MTTPRRCPRRGVLHGARAGGVARGAVTGVSPRWTPPGRARYKAMVMEHSGNGGTWPEAE
ncbi:MAG: hypothetical protein LBU75_07585 [Desulfovibrio sp.]|jgi:hypothetical protein|nr:hypothetical protein [Desulfovibrio sp.]